MIPFTPDERRAQFAPSQNVGGPVDPDILDIIGERPQPTMAQQVEYEVPEVKPVDPDVLDIVNESQGPMMASLMGASRVNPDQAAEAKRLGSQIGVGQDIALRNLEDVRKRAFMADIQRRDIARANPVLAGFLSDPTFANEASDDIGSLERVGSFFADVGRAIAGRPYAMQYIPMELTRGYMRGQLIAERGEIGTRAIMGEAEDTNFERAKQIQEEMRGLSGGGILASTAEVVAQNVAQAREVVGAGLIGGATGSVIPGLGTMAGFAGGLGTGVVLTTAKSEAGNLYLDLKEQEINDETAVPVALGAGLLNGVIEAVGMKIAAAPFRQLANRVMREQIAEAVRKPTMRAALAQAGKAYAMQVGTEATEEGLQEIVNIAGEELAKGMEGIDSETTMRDAAKRVLDSFVQGAMGSAILGGIGPGANLYVDLRRSSKATKQTQFFNDLVQTSAESKLKARDAGAYERFVAATADGTGADTIFVDGATMRTVLSQAEVTDAQLEAIVPGLAQQVRQAAEQGNDVTIPTAQFAARLAGTKLGDGLLPHMRLSPDAMSATEAQQFEQNREALVEEARALLESKTESESAFVQEADQVATTMRERLIAAGRDPALAEVESLVHQAFVVTQAARQGKTPAQFEAESGLREIVGAEMPAAPLEQANQFDQAGQRRTDTPEFKAWFGDSKVATTQGVPITVYHGTNAKFDAFDPTQVGKNVNRPLSGFYFSDESEIAATYGPNIIKAYLSIQKPYVVDFDGANWDGTTFDEETGEEIQVLPSIDEIVEEAKKLGYDGVIAENVSDVGALTGAGDDRLLNTTYVVFDPTSIKSVDNRGTWSRTTANIMEQAAVQPRLMAVHNLSADNLQFADQMGGLAVPSIGVITQERGGVEGFGEITLLGTREMADPATSRVFSSDAYSARFPSAEWPKVPLAKADKFVAQLRAVAKKYDDRRIIDETFDAMVNNPNAEKVVGYWMRSMAVRALFLSENGIDIAPIMRAKKTLSGLSWDQIDALRTAYEAVDQNLAYSDMEASPEYQALKDRYAAAIRQKFEPARDDIDSATIERWASDFTPTTLSRLQRDMADTERTAVDSIATGEAIDAAMDPLKAEFKSWVDTKVRNQFGAPFIRIGRTRKPYTLNNIVDVMTSEKVRGEEKAMTFGAGAARAAAATEFVDLEQMREAAKSAIVSPDEYAKASKSSNAELEAYRNAVIDYTTLTDWRGKSDTWAALDGSMRALATYGTSKRKGPATMRRVLAQEGFASKRIPNDLIDQAIAAAETLFNAPVPYFEAKPQRAVRLGEFGGAVIPSDASQEVRDILERNGIAYMTYLAGNEEDRQRAVREMAQSQEARGEVLFQAQVPAAFYSALGRAIDGIDIKSASAAGWKERIKGLVNKGDIKQDELTWSGLEDWLSLPREGKITKDEVAEFLKNNGVRVEQIVPRQPKYAQYTLPGGTNYREVLLTLPVDVNREAGARDRRASTLIAERNALQDAINHSVEPGERAELERRLRNTNTQIDLVLKERTEAGTRTAFRSQHWTQPNVVAHLRMNDRVDADGKRVLFVEEIQSDWAQAGRKKGFRVAPEREAELRAKIKQLESLGTAATPEQKREWAAAMNELQPETNARKVMPAPFVARQQFAVFKGDKEVTRKNKEGKEVKQRYSSMKAAEAAAAKVGGEARDIGMQADTEGWVNLALKQIMLEAVNGGYDKVAFINGEQSKDRYDLGKEVDRIVVAPRDDGKSVNIELKAGDILSYGVDADGVITATTEDSGRIAKVGTPLADVIGKEMAEKVMQTERGTFAGEDLKVGGEGMVAFYDKIVPSATSKLLEKLDGGRLGQVGITEQGTMRNLSVHSDGTQYWLEFNDGTRASGNVASYLEADAIREQLERGISKQPGFDVTDALREKVTSGLPLFQAMPGRGPARGGYDPSRLKILFGKGADFTTGAHELTHYYVDYYTKQAIAGTAAPQMLADLDIMFKFMGVAGATPEERLAAFNAMPFETSRPLIETITYNAEIYLFEGKAPSLELAGVFDRMLAFFRRAYKSIADFVTQQREIYRREFGRELPELSDELRQVFDRMLADERQIKQAQAVAQMRGQFTVKPEGMDDAEWAAYQEMAGEATNAAIADMTKASLRQMEWLSRARSRIIKDMQARHTAQRKEVRERVQREVQQEPLYRAMAFLRRGQVVAPDGTVTEAEGVHKIDRVLAAEFAPTVDLARLGGRFGVLQDDGLHPDIVAEMFGYPAGATLLQDLADAKPMREVVEDRTDAEMLRLYGEMNTPAAREQEIQKALHNEARARLVGVELRFMGKIQQPVRVLLEAARQAAQQAIGRRRIVEIRPSEFVAAEAKASREVTAAMQENKPDVAVRAKRAQLLNNQLAKASLEAKDEIDNGVRYLRRVLRDSNRQRMGADVADQIASLLDRFNIAPMTADEARRVGTLAEFLATLEDRGLVPDIAEAIGMRDTRIPYKNMTVTEFRDLVDAVKQLEYIGKNERKILLAKEKAEFESVRDQIVASVIENAGDRKDNSRTATTNIGRAVTAMKGFAAAHLKAASIVRILDGGKDGGPLWNYLIRSANEAGDSETSMRAEATADLTKILEPVFRAGKLGGKGVFFPTINRSLNREARLVVALNMGNTGNMQRLLDGEGWSIESIMPVLQSLTEDELNTVQQIWDYFEKYRPMIGQKERRLYGKEPAWVDPQPLVVRSADGKTITLRGGYYPIKYDPKASMRAETMSEAEEAKRDLAGAYTTATTRRSFTKARVRKVEGRPLLYTLAGMYGGINDVIHDLTWHEWLITANRLMRSNSFDDAVRNRYGPEYVTQLKNWIKDVAAGERGVQNEAEMALNFLRQGISSAGLGFNIVSAAMQITGFNQSIVRVGAKWIGRGIAYTVTNPMLAMQEVNEKSEFMRNRSRTQFRELNEIRNMVQGQSIAMRRVQMGTYFLMMRMQRMVDVPTWHGAYEKAMHEGRDEETAIALADQAVIDSQGGGMVKDLARVERGGPAVKLFTVFYGYMNTVYNMAAVQTMTNKNKGRLAADYAMLFVVPVVLSYMLKQALIPRKGDEEEEWDMGKIGRELAAEQLSYLMGTMVIAREFGEVGKMIFGVEGPRMGYGGPAGLRAIGETYQFATQASQGEFDRAFRKSAVNMIGAFTGLPSAQVNRTLDGLEALYEGETENVLAPLTGAKKQ